MTFRQNVRAQLLSSPLWTLSIQLGGRSLFPLTDLTAPTSMNPQSFKEESCSLGWP